MKKTKKTKKELYFDIKGLAKFIDCVKKICPHMYKNGMFDPIPLPANKNAIVEKLLIKDS